MSALLGGLAVAGFVVGIAVALIVVFGRWR
jgi:hypothetical protein